MLKNIQRGPQNQQFISARKDRFDFLPVDGRPVPLDEEMNVKQVPYLEHGCPMRLVAELYMGEPLLDSTKAILPAELKPAHTLLDLYALPDGEKW